MVSDDVVAQFIAPVLRISGHDSSKRGRNELRDYDGSELMAHSSRLR
jgi:hypothetical protein